MSNKTIEKQARQLCRHTVTYTEITQVRVAARAMQGRTTRAIAAEFGISLSEAQYRITKAQKAMKTYFRADYRGGHSPLILEMLRATEHIGRRVVRDQIAPKFIPLARPGVSRTPL